MRLGILIIGSLYWDPSRVRCRWRQSRLSCTEEAMRRVKVPIRYGKKSKSRGYTYTMVFAKSCCRAEALGTGLVVPARAECCEPDNLFEEAEHLWGAEQNVEERSDLCAKWGKVCILKNPVVDGSDRILQAWHARIRLLGSKYVDFPTAYGEDPVVDNATGLALFDWPKDIATNQDLLGFDVLLMTATKPDLIAGQYPTAKDIAMAWRADTKSNVLYFHNNCHYGITTFEDDPIQALLCGELPNQTLDPTRK